MLGDLVAVLTSSNYRPSLIHCWRCDTYKNRSEFGMRNTKLQSTCKCCNRAYQREWYRRAKAEGRR